MVGKIETENHYRQYSNGCQLYKYEGSMLNLTTLFSTLISSVINGTVTFLAIRYVGKMAEKAECKLKKE